MRVFVGLEWVFFNALLAINIQELFVYCQQLVGD